MMFLDNSGFITSIEERPSSEKIQIKTDAGTVIIDIFEEGFDDNYDIGNRIPDENRIKEGVLRLVEGMRDKRHKEELEWAKQFSMEDLEYMFFSGEIFTIAGNEVAIDGTDEHGYRSPFLILS